MQTWIGYAKRHHEFEVEEALQAIGIDVWCPREIVWKALGTNRRPKAYERPVLPNYLFISVEPEQFLEAKATRGIEGPMAMVSPKAMVGTPDWVDENGVLRKGRKGINDYRKMIDEAYEIERRRQEQGDAPSCEFVSGQRVIVRAMEAEIGTFRRLVQNYFDIHPKIEVDMQMMGRTVPVLVDPLDVKAAEG